MVPRFPKRSWRRSKGSCLRSFPVVMPNSRNFASVTSPTPKNFPMGMASRKSATAWGGNNGQSIRFPARAGDLRQEFGRGDACRSGQSRLLEHLRFEVERDLRSSTLASDIGHFNERLIQGERFYQVSAPLVDGLDLSGDLPVQVEAWTQKDGLW